RLRMRPHGVPDDDDAPRGPGDAPPDHRVVGVELAEMLEASLGGDGRVLRVGDGEYPLPLLRPLVEAVLTRPRHSVHDRGGVPRADDADRPDALPRLVLLLLDPHPSHRAFVAVPLGHPYDVDVAARLEDL